MFLLIQDNDYIARLQSRFLVALSVEGDPLAIFHTCMRYNLLVHGKKLCKFLTCQRYCKHTFVNMNFQNFFLAFHLVPIAVLAAVPRAEFFTLSLAVRTYALDLLDHAWSNLLHPNLNSFTFAG